MRQVVISLNPDRVKALDYECEVIQGCHYSETPDWIRKAFSIMYNEHTKTSFGYDPPRYEDGEWVSLPAVSKVKNRIACFTAHMNALQHIIDKKYNDTVILEDDSQIDRESMVGFDTASFPQDAPTLLGGCFHHPTSWGKDKAYIRDILPDLIKEFKHGINPLDYSKYRWTQASAIYYPRWETALWVISKVKAIGHRDFKTGYGPYKHYDIFLSEHRLVKYFHYPSVFTHNDRIDKDRQVIKGHTSLIGKGEGIVKNYVNLGKSADIVKKHTPPRSKPFVFPDDPHN